MKQHLSLALCWLAFNAEGACSIDTRGEDYPSRAIALQKAYPEGGFYYRADHYAIVVEPATLTRRLEEQAASGVPSDGRLLKDILGDTSSSQYKDLFALVLKDPLYLLRIERLLAEVLQNGEASVVDAYELPGDAGRFLSATVLVQIETRSYKGREFCTPTGDLLLKITDQID